MKNLILTFVFALVTIITFSQSLQYKINSNDSRQIDVVQTLYSSVVVTPAQLEDSLIQTINLMRGDSLIFLNTIDVTLAGIYSNPNTENSGINYSIENLWLSSTNTIDTFFTENNDIDYSQNDIATVYLKYRINSNNINWVKIVIGQGTTGINDIKAENIELNVYPNPVQDIATVTFTPTQEFPVELYSLSGQLIFTETNTMVGTNNVQLNMSDLPQGMYLVKVGSTTFRTIKN